MRILLAAHGFPPEQFGGTEMYTYYLAKELVRRGHEVHVMYTRPDKEALPYKTYCHEMDGITCWRVPIRQNYVVDLKDTYRDVLVDSQFYGTMKKVRPDIVHFVYLLGGLSASMVPVCRSFGIPNIVTLTDFVMMCPRGQLLQPGGVQCDGPGDSRICASCLVESAEHLEYLEWLRGVGNPVGVPEQVVSTPKWSKVLKQAIFALPVREEQKSKLEHGLWNTWVRLRTRGKQRRALAADASPGSQQVTGEKVRQAAGVRRIPGLERAEGMFAARAVYLRWILEQAGCVVAPTSYLGRKFTEWGLDMGRIHYAEYGIDDSLFRGFTRKPCDHVRFGYIGQILPHKGLKTLLEAFGMLGETTATLTVYGDTEYGPAEEYFREIEYLTRRPGITIAGTFPPGLIAQVMAEIDVLVVPSLWAENSPLVVRNALLAKIPMIVSNVDGLTPYVKHDQNGLTFETGNSQALFECLRQIVDDPHLVERFSEGSLPTKTIAQDADDLLEVYERLIRENRAGAQNAGR